MNISNFIRRVSGVVICAAFLTALTQCEENDEATMGINGKVSMSITDAPIDDENVKGVILTFQRIEIHSSTEGWITLQEFEEPVSIDLLAFQNGESYFLTEEEMPAGTYSEVRLVLDMEQENTHILYNDGTTQPLKVPSGSRSGYKVKGDFTVPAGGVVNLTIDWDLRKAIVEAGKSGQFILKPTARLVVNENAAMIRGTVADSIGLYNIVAYAYHENEFDSAEFVNISEEGLFFPNAVTSAVVNKNNQFTLAFLAAGTYDLYFIEYDENGNFSMLAGESTDITLTPGEVESIEVTLQEQDDPASRG